MHQLIRVRFELQGFDCNPSDITARLGITPTQTWQKGDNTMPHVKRTEDYPGARNNYWGVDSGADSLKDDLEKHLSSLLKKLQPRLERIRALGPSFETRIWVSAHYYEDASPGFLLDPKLLKEIAELHTSLDVEFWCPGMDAEEAETYIAKSKQVNRD